jgi:hypothetical protein
LEAWFDWDEKVVLLDETKSDKGAWSTDVPVDVCRRRDEDQTGGGRGGCRAELGEGGVEEGVSNGQACEGSPKNDNVERLVQSSRDFGCSGSRACVTCFGRWIDSWKDAVVAGLGHCGCI